jgi:hypothetical protein
MTNATRSARTALFPPTTAMVTAPKSHERPSLAIKRPRPPVRVANLPALHAEKTRLRLESRWLALDFATAGSGGAGTVIRARSGAAVWSPTCARGQSPPRSQHEAQVS